MERKRIMIISKTLTGGGAERVATNLAGCLADYADVELVVFNAEHNTYGATVPTVDLRIPSKRGANKLKWHYLAYQKVKAEKKKFRPTHSISFIAEPDLANVLSRGKDKIIVSVRNKQSELDTTKLLLQKNKWIYHKADAVVALSKMVKQDLLTAYGVEPEKVTPIYNPCYIDTIAKRAEEDVLSPEEKTFFEKNKGKLVISAGRLNQQKGQWHLIRAFPKVLESVPDAKLVILGQGGEEEYLRGLIGDLGLQENVFLYGFKANPYAYLSKADVFAFPSVFEGLGNILLECMACGLPIVSTDCPYGPKELLAPGEDLNTFVQEVHLGEYGVLVPPMGADKNTASEPLQHSEECMAEALIRMLTEDSLREDYRKRITERSEYFAPEKITRQWLNVIDSLQ